MKYTTSNMDPTIIVQKMTDICTTSNIPSINCELFRFDRTATIEKSTTLLYTVINTEEYIDWLKRHLLDYFTLLPYEYDCEILRTGVVRDYIVVSATFSLPTHYHNSEPCWENERDCIPCRVCGGRMELGEFGGRGCSRSCAYGR